MIDLDLSLKLLSGMPIKIDNLCTLFPTTLKKIAETGVTIYNQYLSILCLETEDIKKLYDIKEDISPFDFITTYSYHNNEYEKIVIEAFEFFIKEPVRFNRQGFFYLGELDSQKYIDQNNYELFRKVIRKQNCLDYLEEEKALVADEKTREILEKMKKAEEMVRKIKNGNQDGESLSLFDLVSILAGHGNNLNLSNIWDLTMFQFNDAFNRMKMLEEYTVNIQSLLHGADSKKIELVHWMSKIKKD